MMIVFIRIKIIISLIQFMTMQIRSYDHDNNISYPDNYDSILFLNSHDNRLTDISRRDTEVKQRRACSITKWVTAREYQML